MIDIVSGVSEIERPRARRQWLAAGGITALAFAVYWATRTSRPSWDPLRYAVWIADQRIELLADARHPLGTLLAYAAYWFCEALGIPIDPITTLQLCAALAAASALGGAYLLLRRSMVPAPTAAAAIFGLGATRSYWQQAADGGVYGVSAAAVVAAWAALLLGAQRSVRRAGLAGAAQAVAVLAHQSNSVFVPCALLWLWRTGRARNIIAAYVGGLAVVTALGYAVAWRFAGRMWSWAALDAWFTGAFRALYYPHSEHIARDYPGAVVRSLIAVPAAPSQLLGQLAALFVVGLVVALALATALRVYRRRADVRTTVLGIAAVLGGIAATWWDPVASKYWVASWIAAWLALAFGLYSAGRRAAVPLACAASVVCLLNAPAMLEKARAPNPFRTAALQVAALTTPNDLIVVGTNAFGPTLEYVSKGRIVRNVFEVFVEAVGLRQAGRENLAGLVGAARMRGGRIFVTSDALDISADRRRGIDALPGTLAELFPGQRLVMVARFVTDAPRVLYEVVPES